MNTHAMGLVSMLKAHGLGDTVAAISEAYELVIQYDGNSYVLEGDTPEEVLTDARAWADECRLDDDRIMAFDSEEELEEARQDATVAEKMLAAVEEWIDSRH